ncbi:chromosome segregation protein SMC [Pseudalkalibacillus caeni]|uniref:Chromosome partition protein Smc n=1 Tax=Exobacillus caeni TaxID=2574798 RepID=A0A5R9F198_9BACL|nr:chromosome segregation protein SMC [Pseudalkalibacillus caeni]TLS37337.1 chromosome segregation protein SMC [Pseudalkalibacillus caeni]
MFLKRLDVAGFKSFAERISVEFVPGVTAVVGPNGSGKSNINDSIRWVLGEQSAKSLRGSKMEDIIFAGSDTRKPLNLAEVTLTLDNQDQYLPIEYNEVSVTRRVYRSGDSEYLINNQPCRLKDIIDLFMDSGLGKESFSIIGQGKIEEILSSKSEERRKIFEEAAGVLKYKQRKQKAVAKLAETEENLHRVEDILYELEDQVEPLKIQASIAKDYLAKREELEKIETALIVHEIEELHGKWESKSTEINSLIERERALSEAVAEKETELDGLKSEIEQVEQKLDQKQESLLITSEDLEKLEGKKEVLKERKKNADQNKENLKHTIQSHQNKKAHLNSEIKRQTELFNKQKRELTELKNRLEKETKLLQDIEQDIETELEKLKSDYFEMLNEQASMRNENRYLNEQLTGLKSKSDRLDQENKKFLDQRKEVQLRKKDLELQLKSVKDKLQKHVSSYYKTKQDVDTAEKEFREKESNLYQAYQYIQQFRSRKEMLEEMQEDYSGFFQGVKEVLKARDDLTGIEGAIAELVTVPKEVETAIETALGGAMQHVVVQTEADGRKAIQFLKAKRFGRATFLPMNVVRPRKIGMHEKSSISSHSSYVGIAADLIKFDARYADILNNLLGNVIVTRDLKGANEIARLLQYRFRIVTTEGDIVNPGGSMSGGAVKQKSTSLLSRQRELETVEEKLATMENKVAVLEEEVKKDRESITQKKENLEDMRETGEELRLEEQSFIRDIKEIEMEEGNINDRLSLYDREKSSISEEKDSNEERRQFLSDKLEKVSKEAEKLEKKIERLTHKKKNQQTSKESLQTEITDLKVKVAEHQQAFTNKKETLDRLVNEQKENQELLSTAEEDFWLLEEAVSSNNSGEEKLEEEIKQKRTNKNDLLSVISSLRNNRASLNQQIEAEETELKGLKQQEKQIGGLLKAEEVQINRLDVELENRLGYLGDEYGLTYERAKEKHVLSMEATEARKRIKLIKMEIEELGTVNLGAIEEYERISGRYEFLTEQQSDLNHAKETLYSVINEMDEEMKRRFEDTFVKIRSNFQDVFTELFGGGKADLVLTNPDDLLATGVDILAQPPGKKLQHLALLSGGERAFTAIALLFSILMVRPVPFCVLDEVEAALDEANVNRFASFLKRFSEETQFIVITHRKGTMEEADVLYGVTMQESGVSNLVSVRLEESKELVKQ